MNRKRQSLRSKEELLVDLTFYDMSINLLREFTLQVVRPYYAGSLIIAVKDLMEKAVVDHEFLNNHIKK